MVDEARVDLGPGAWVTARRYDGGPSARAVLVLAHGAGASQASDFMVTYASGLASRGLTAVTFPVLETCYRAVLQMAASGEATKALPLFIGGKSLGGRMASHVAAAGARAGGIDGRWWDRLRGLVFLGYPLHPPGRPQQVRVSHLPRIVHPMLVVQGARDAFGTPAELRLFFDVLPAPAEVHVVEQGDHSFEVPKRSGLAQVAVHAGVQDRIATWISARLGSSSDEERRPMP